MSETQTHVQPVRGAIPLTGIFILVCLYTLYFAAPLLIPIAIAIFLNIMLSPVVRRLHRLGVARSLAAGLMIVVIVGLTGLIGGTLAGPAEEWLRDAPRTIRGVQQRMFNPRGALADIQALAEEVDGLAEVDKRRAAPEVVLREDGVFGVVVDSMPAFFGAAVIVVFLTYFLLASGDNLLRRITLCGRTWSERRRIVTIARHIQSELSRYLATVAMINTGLGFAVAAAMYGLGVPNPILWGAMVAVFNFAPYVGAMASAAVLTMVGFTTFPTLGDALLVPTAFIVLTILEGQLVTPTILGARMALSPTIVFVSVIAWGWLWGVAGALMAVPIVTAIKVVCRYFSPVQYLGTFLRNDHAAMLAETPHIRLHERLRKTLSARARLSADARRR